MARTERMHQTTVRFSPQLWEMLEREAKRSGVSAAHYIRDSALARLAYAAGKRSNAAEEDAFAWADPSSASALQASSDGEAAVEDSPAVQAHARLQTVRAEKIRSRAKASGRARTGAKR